jgi:hypothetical protein
MNASTKASEPVKTTASWTLRATSVPYIRHVSQAPPPYNQGQTGCKGLCRLAFRGPAASASGRQSGLVLLRPVAWNWTALYTGQIQA